MGGMHEQHGALARLRFGQAGFEFLVLKSVLLIQFFGRGRFARDINDFPVAQAQSFR